MQFTAKDRVASALVAAAVVIYAAYVAFDGIPFARDATGMAAIALFLGFASRRVGGRHGFAHERAAFIGALGCVALGVATLITESEALLAVFMAATVGLWGAAIYVHAHARRPQGLGYGRIPAAR